MAFSPDGKRLASAAYRDNTVKVWDAANGQEVLALRGHTESVLSIAFSPDGKRLASGSADETVRLWELANGQEVLTLRGHTDFVHQVAFSPDGKRLASSSEEIIIWDASKSMPDSSADLNKLGIGLAAKNQLDEAIAAFRKAIEIDPRFAAAYNNLGIALHRKNQLDEAIAAYRKAIDLDRKTAPAYTNLGNALRDKNQLDEAIAAYRQAIDIAPKEAKVHNGLAWLLATCADQRLRDPATALASAKKAIELDPKNGNYWGTFGTAHYRSGEWQEALGALDKAVSLKQGGNSSDFFFLAMAHRQLGHADQARAWYDKGVQWMEKNRPKDDEMQRFRAEAAELLGIQILDALTKDMAVPKK